MISHAKASPTDSIAKRGVLALLISFLALLVFAPQALAAKSVVKSLGSTTTGTTGGQFTTPRGVAVNQTGNGAPAGTFYVVDSANHRIQQFNPAGEFVRTWGWGVRDGEAEFQVCKTAATCQAGIAGPGSGQLNAPQGIAIDQATGNLYVSDQGNRRIDVFGPNGAFQGAFGYGARTGAVEFQFCTTSCVAPNTATGAQGGRFGAAIGGLAVDPTSGNLYVASKSNKRVDVFKPILTGAVVSGAEFLRAFGWDTETGGVATFEVCTLAANCKAGATGTNPGQFGLANSPGDVAVDSEGNVYVADTFNKRVQKFSSAPALITATFGATAINETFGTEIMNVAVDPSSAPNRVLVSSRRSASANKVAVLELDHSGSKLHLHGEALTPSAINTASTGIAVAKATLGGNLYLSTATTGTLQGVYVLNEGPTVEAASAIADHGATLHGQVVSNEAATSYRFEYMPAGGSTWTKLPATDASAGTSTASAAIAATGPSTGTLTVKARGGAFTLTFNEKTTTPLAHDASAAAVQAALEALSTIGAGNVTVSGGPGSPDGSTPYAISFTGALAGTEVTQITAFAANLLAPTIAVSQVATGLNGNTKYQVKLVATRPAGGLPIASPEASFKTLGAAPTVSGATASEVTDTSAKLEGKVNPENQSTSYQFEYLSQAAYEANGNSFSGPEPAAKAPASPANIGAGSLNVSVSQQIDGLEPATAYRVRLTASNGTGATTGAEGSFTTLTPFPESPPFGPCPNDEFRTGAGANLPDCRAYEQASPVDKSGQDAAGRVGDMAASIDGNAVLYYTKNGQPGGEGPQTIPRYIARRDGGQWSARGVLPPISFGDNGVGMRGWTPDLSQVFLGTTFLNSPTKNLVANDSTEGTFAAISTAGEGDFVGADGSLAYFEAGADQAPLVPGAAAGKPNLYAWDRDTNALALAGVLPDSACATPPCVPKEGTTVQGDFPVPAHAVTASGDAYFADAGTGRLYLRKDPFGSPSTVLVSGSQRTDCAGDPSCGGDSEPDPAPQAPLPATFQAATPDGEHAFFTSGEELTDESNTGPDVDPPAIGRANAADGTGVDKTFAFLLDTPPAAIDADAEHLYWIEPGTDSIARSDLDGTNVDHEFVTGLVNPQDLAVDADHIYWTSIAPGETSLNKISTIGRADLPTNPGDPVANVTPSCITGLETPTGVDVNGSFLYWLSKSGDSWVGRADISASCATADATKVTKFSDNTVNTPQSEIAVNDNHIYAGGYGGFSETFRIRQFNIADGSSAGSTSFLFASAPTVPIAANDSSVYWGNSLTGTITRADLDLTNVNGSFITGLTAPVGLVLGQGADSGHLYWTTGITEGDRGRDLYRYDASSGDLTDLSFDDTTELGADVLALLGASEDGSRVYFVANADLDDDGPAQSGDCSGSLFGKAGANDQAFDGECSIYLAHGGDVTFVARLDIAELTSGSKGKQSDAANWGVYPEGEPTARVSADGKTLLFRSQRQLTAYDNDGPQCVKGEKEETLIPGPCTEIYRYQVEDGLLCVSCDPTGAAPTGAAQLTQIEFSPSVPTPPARRQLARNLSADGNRVFFQTPDRLLAADVNGASGCPLTEAGTGIAFPACLDVYMWEAEGTGTCESSAQNGGCLYLISTGTGPVPSFFLGASASGEDAFFFTREQLVPQDTDGLMDVYDARVEGGLVGQHETTAAQCEGDACRGEASSAPNGAAAGSAVLVGPGNQRPSRANKVRRRCPKGKRRVRRGGKARCVVKQQRNRKRAANNHRRASR